MRSALAFLFAVFIAQTGCWPEDDRNDEIVVSPPEDEFLSADLQNLLALHNQDRQSLGLSELLADRQLSSAAQKHADWMARSGRLSHSGESNSSVADRVRREGYSWSSVGENIAHGYASPSSVMSGWLNSTGHRNNIRRSNYRHVGLGLAEAKGRKWWCVVFASPARSGSVQSEIYIYGPVSESGVRFVPD